MRKSILALPALLLGISLCAQTPEKKDDKKNDRTEMKTGKPEPKKKDADRDKGHPSKDNRSEKKDNGKK